MKKNYRNKSFKNGVLISFVGYSLALITLSVLYYYFGETVVTFAKDTWSNFVSSPFATFFVNLIK